MLHIAKLAVGVRDAAHLAALQAARAREPPLCHRTRAFPRRAAEILDGGSIYWVIRGIMLLRQRLIGIEAETGDDGASRTRLLLDPTLVPVRPRPTKPFQGWRYLAAADAPPDDGGASMAEDGTALPEQLRRDLQRLCLL